MRYSLSLLFIHTISNYRTVLRHFTAAAYTMTRGNQVFASHFTRQRRCTRCRTTGDLLRGRYNPNAGQRPQCRDALAVSHVALQPPT